MFNYRFVFRKINGESCTSEVSLNNNNYESYLKLFINDTEVMEFNSVSVFSIVNGKVFYEDKFKLEKLKEI